MSRYSTEQLKRGGVAPLHYNNVGGPTKTSVNSSLSSSSIDENNTSTTTAATSVMTGSTTSGFDSSLPRYRPDYSRAQHPTIPWNTLSPTSMRTLSPPSSGPVLSPSASTMSPEQIRFEKYVNRFAVHDHRSSPIMGQKEAAPDPQAQLNVDEAPPPLEKLSVSERINRFNNAGAQHQNLPLPLNHHGTSPLRHNPVSSRVSNQTDSMGSASDGDQNRRSSNAYDPAVVSGTDLIRTPTNSLRKGYAALPSQYPSALQAPKVTASTSTVTTATNVTTSSSTSEAASLPATSERRDIPSTPPTSRFIPGRSVRPLVAEGPRSYSYDHPRSTTSIETRSPARVAELRKKLWDNNETLQVAVPPSLHYVGGRNGDDGDHDDTALVESKCASLKGTPKKTVVVLKGPEMAGRYGQRSRSHSPRRPQYVSTFKTRYYEAALASSRQSSTSVPVANNFMYQGSTESVDRVQLERQLRRSGSPQDVPGTSRKVDVRYNSRNGIDEVPKHDHILPTARRPQQPNDYGPLKAHSLDTRVSNESQHHFHQQHLQNQMLQSSTNSTQQQPRQLTTTATPSDGSSNNTSSKWRRPSMPSLVDETSDTTSGEASVAKLVAKLNSISRDNPAEALAQIDSILRAESKSDSGDLDQARNLYLTPAEHIQEEKKDEYERVGGEDSHCEDEDDDDDDDDDETSMSSITNPSYAHPPIGPPSVMQSLSLNRIVRPNSLQLYQQGLKATEQTRSKGGKQRTTPPTTIQVKEQTGVFGANQVRGHLQQLLSNETGESRNAAAIAMKIHMWDELSTSRSSLKMDEAISTVPSLQEEIFSATTDELGSIVTPADPAAHEIESSSHRESPLVMSAIPTPQSSLLALSNSLEPSHCANRPDEFVTVGNAQKQPDDVVHSQHNEQRLSRERGRQLYRNDSPPPNYISSASSLTPRRNHPWDHHHPRNTSISSEQRLHCEKSDVRDSSDTVDYGKALKLRPIDPAPITSPRNALPVRRDDPVSLGQISTSNGSHNLSIVEAEHRLDAQSDNDIGHTVSSLASGQVQSRGAKAQPDHVSRSSALGSQSNNKRRERVAIPNDTANKTRTLQRGVAGTVSSPTHQTAQTPTSVSDGSNGWNTSVFKGGDSFEVDPKLLKENDEFGFPIRVKKEETPVAVFSNDFDTAWVPLAVDPFFSAKKSTSPRALDSQQSPSRRQKTVRDVVNASADFSHDPSGSTKQQSGRTDTQNRSPARARFNMLSMKRKQDSDVPASSMDHSLPVKPIKVVTFDETVHRKPAESNTSKFNLLNLKRSRDGGANKGASLQDQNRPSVKSPGRPNSASPSRERSGSFNIVQRFNRLMREREGLD